ncbi:MAG: hypothetical protein AAGB14_16155, partial [Verrucomicrobiota bacterium]
WALTHPQDLMSGDNEAWIELTFRDDSDTVLSIFRSAQLNSSSIAPGTWTNLQVTEEFDPLSFARIRTVGQMVAPAGTTKARLQIVYRQPAFGGGAMYFDDLQLVEDAGPPPFLASIRPGKVVSWTPGAASSIHQPQASDDQIDWVDLGNELEGNTVDAVFDGEGAAHYRVVETIPDSTLNGVANPGFETTEAAAYPSPGAAGWTIQAAEDTNPADGSASMTVESSYGVYGPNSGSEMLVFESITPPSPAFVSAPATNVRSDLMAVNGNTNYEISFYAAHVMKQGGANPQFNLRYFNSSMVFIGENGFESFSSLGSSWTRVSEPFTTPAAAAYVSIEWIQALGAGNDGHWVTLIDDVELPVGTVPGGQNVLPASVTSGVEVSWPTEVGYLYQVEAGALLDSFTDVGPSYSGNGLEATYFEEIAGDRRFYRVRKSMAP